MLLRIPSKVAIAILVALALLDLQLLVSRYFKRGEMLGLYLRQHIDGTRCAAQASMLGWRACTPRPRDA